MSIVEEVRRLAVARASVSRPRSQCVLVGIGESRGEPCIVYEMQKRADSKQSSTKRIPLSAFNLAARQLAETGEVTREWFELTYPELRRDGTCSFTTLGGILELIGIARYGRGRYLGLIGTRSSDEIHR